MPILRSALTALLIGATTPILVSPAFAQTCACPTAGGFQPGPVIEAEEPPPPLPVYDQPPLPAPGHIWTPGYWAWNNYDYYWVPGVWVPPPQPGVLWTPGYWAFVGGIYRFHQGYWGPHVGFYGGVNYGAGYNGLGYEGGRWEGNRFVYNTTVNNFGGVHVTNVYTQAVQAAPGAGRASFNGGPGGVTLRPTPEQERLTTEERLRPTPLQVTHARAASMDTMQFRSANQGKPPVAATARPGDLKGPGATPARAAGTAEVGPGAPPIAVPGPNGAQPLSPGAKPGEPAFGQKPGVGATPAPIGEKPLSPESPALARPGPGATPIGEPKLPPGAKPQGQSLPADARPVEPGQAPAGEKRPNPEAPALANPGLEKGPDAPMKPEGAQGPAAGERARIEAAPGAPKGPPGEAGRKLERAQTKDGACGKPGEAPCR